MKIPRVLYLAAAALIVIIIAAGCATMNPVSSSEATKAFEKGNKLAHEAQDIRGALKQGNKFKAAVAEYDVAARVDIKKNPEMAGTVAQALLAKGKVLAGMSVDSSPAGGFKRVFKPFMPWPLLMIFPSDSFKDDISSRDTFRQLNQVFARPSEKLVDDYGAEDARKIQDVLRQTKGDNGYENLIGIRIDQTNRGKILYQIMDAMVRLTGRNRAFSYWFAIILITVIVKIITTPLTKAQFRSMKEMQRLQPLVKALQEKYKGDQREVGAKIMDLYKEHGVNPLSGCIPLLIQMPVLFTLYYTIMYYEYQFQQGSFLWIGWEPFVHKIAVPLMGKPVWVTAASLAQPDLILLVLYTVSMIVSQKISVVDPTQAEQQKMMAIMMPIMFFFIIGYLPSAFVLYWFVMNVLQTWQQYHVIHGGNLPPLPLPEPEPEPGEVVSRPAPTKRKKKKK